MMSMFLSSMSVRRALLGTSLVTMAATLHAQPAPEPSPPVSPDTTAPASPEGAVQSNPITQSPAETSGQNPPAPPEEEAAPGEIVVTALKRATTLQQTPLAISAVSAASLVSQGITDSQQLTRTAPNLIINENANGGSRVIIRNLFAPGEPLVGLYYDETPITGTSGVSNDAGGTQPGIRLFDVERAEVLRGPQGTLYGASSMGGTIRLIFAKPDLDDFQGAVNGQVTDAKHGSSNIGTSADAMINLPIITDRLAVRAVGFYDRTPGFLDNSILGLKDYNKNRSFGGRLLVRARPVENLTIDLMATYQDRDGWNPTWNLTRLRLLDQRFDQNLRIQTPQSDRFQLYSGTLNWDFGFATLTSVTSYSKRDLKVNFDFSPFFSRYFTGASTAAAIPGYANFAADCNRGLVAGTANCSREEYQRFVTSFGILTAFQPQSTKTTTQEVRLANADNALKWTIGFFYSDRDNFTRSLLNTVDANGRQLFPQGYSATPYGFGSRTHLDRTITDELSQVAGFAEATWDVNEKLGLTAGIRFFEYKKSTGAEVIIPNYVAGNVRLPFSELSDKESGKLLKFNVNYKFNRDLMVYALAAEGYRPGGVNQTLGLPSYATNYGSDSLWNYELGVKSTLIDRKLTLNVDVFQMDWKDVQISASFQGAFGFITNTPSKIRIRGIEVDSSLYPMDGLTLRASGSYTSAKLQDDIALPAGIDLCTGSPPYVGCAVLVGIGRKGNTVPFSPKWTGQASADYTHGIGGGDLELYYHGDVSYRSSAYNVYDRNAANVTVEDNKLPGFATVGLRFGLQNGDRWGVYLFANNLFDVIGAVNKTSSRTSSTIIPTTVNGVTTPSVFVTAGPPRIIGLQARTRF